MNNFRKELQDIINKNSLENGSNTPEFILAEYLVDCLNAFDKATSKRTAYFNANDLYLNLKENECKTACVEECFCTGHA